MTAKGKKTAENVTETVNHDGEGEENGRKCDRDRKQRREATEARPYPHPIAPAEL